jgi:gluconolactonase
MAGRDGAEGYLLASSIIDNVIYKVTAAGKVSVFLDKAGYSSEDFANVGKLAQIGRAHVLLMGPGCAGVDHQGRVIWCAGQDLAIKRLEKDGKVTMAVSRAQLGAEPNGIALSPDDKFLYLSAGTVTPDPRMMRYPVHADGSVGAGELFTHGIGIGDGMKTDPAGNVWSTDALPGTVRITSPTGRLLGLLHMPTLGDAEPRKTTCASSLAFGGDDAKTLYVTACEHIYAIPLRAPGVLEGPAH